MDHNEKLARALKLNKGCLGFGKYDIVDGRQVGTSRYNIKAVKKYLNSPEGQQRIRGRVRELCRDGGYRMEYRYDPRPQRGVAGVLSPYHYICVLLPEKCVERWYEDSEKQAWEAALLWLAERKATDE